MQGNRTVVKLCGHWGDDTCLVLKTDQARADFVCKCNFDKTWTEGGTGRMKRIVNSKAMAVKEPKTADGVVKKGSARSCSGI